MIYRLSVWLRHLAFDKGWKKSFRADIPTIAVGNITVGGTGKTPMTELILRMLLGSDRWAYSNISVLSRGYKRRSKGFQTVSRDSSAAFAGDEPLQIARKFPSVTVAVDKNRIRGCHTLAEGGANVVVLDDAFQYRRLIPSVSVVLVDWSRPVFKDRMLPWGRLRDLPSRLSKADIIVVTKCPHSLDDWQRHEWRRLLKISPGQKLFFTTTGYEAPEPVFPEADSRYTYAQRLVLVSGIANDAPLRSYLSDTYKLSSRIAFGDHHKFTRSDIRSIKSAVKANPTACLMTTEKDAQRFRDVKKMPPEIARRLFYTPVKAEFFTPEERAAFEEALLAAL